MTATPKDEDRRIVPRWRQASSISYAWERRSDPSRKTRESLVPSRLEDDLAAWQSDPSIETAVAVIQSAITSNEAGRAFGAAEFLLANGKAITPAAGELASYVRRPPMLVPTGPLLLGQLEQGQTQPIYKEIHELKAAVRADPKRAVAWVELALRYTVLGHKEAAKRAIDAAVQTGLASRFVVRAAVRFYVHRKEPETALAIIRRTPDAARDPWLISAEIAVGMLCGKTPRYVKHGHAALQSFEDWPGFVTELAGSLATLEMASGNPKGARKLFRKSMHEPNDNAIAQALWAERHLDRVFVDRKWHLLHPNTFEARTMASMTTGDWAKALTESAQWLQDEPFSSRPAQLGSYIACALIDEQNTAIAMIEQALAANPDDALLRNNLVVALAHSGNLARAANELARLPGWHDDPDLRCAMMATHGLVAIKSGDVDKGRTAYYLALTMAEGANAKTNQARVRLHWAECELEKGDVTIAEGLLAPDLGAFIEKLPRPFPDLKFVLARTLSRYHNKKAQGPQVEIPRGEQAPQLPQL